MFVPPPPCAGHFSWSPRGDKLFPAGGREGQRPAERINGWRDETRKTEKNGRRRRFYHVFNGFSTKEGTQQTDECSLLMVTFPGSEFHATAPVKSRQRNAVLLAQKKFWLPRFYGCACTAKLRRRRSKLNEYTKVYSPLPFEVFLVSSSYLSRCCYLIKSEGISEGNFKRDGLI